MRHALAALLCIACMGWSSAWTQVTQPESADTSAQQVQGPQSKDVEIIKTDLFHFAKFGKDSVTIRKLIGNVRLRQDSTYINCDSAFQFLDTNLVIAHGHVLIDAPGAITHLKAHRLKREAKVAAAMRALPNGNLDDWVPLAYDDVPERLWPVAKRSLQAHVDHIRSLGGFNV